MHKYPEVNGSTDLGEENSNPEWTELDLERWSRYSRETKRCRCWRAL